MKWFVRGTLAVLMVFSSFFSPRRMWMWDSSALLATRSNSTGSVACVSRE